MDIVLLMIALSISTYLVSSMYYRHKKREILPNLIVLCYLWLVIAIIIAYWFYYKSLYTMLNFPSWLNYFFIAILGISIIAFAKYLRKHGISKNTSYKAIGLGLSVFIIFYMVNSDYISVQLVLTLNTVIYIAALLLLYIHRDHRQTSLSFVQMLVAIIALSISIALKDIFSREYILGIANGSIFLLSLGSMLYYLEHTTLDITDVNRSLIEERDISEGLRNKYERVLGTVHEGIWEYDVENDRAFLSELIRDFFNVDTEYVEHAYGLLIKHLHPEDVGHFEKEMSTLSHDALLAYLKKECAAKNEREYRLFNISEGRYLWVSLKWGKTVTAGTGTVHLYGTMSVVQNVRDAEERSYQLAYYDQMTGLPNATSYYEYLNAVLNNGSQEHVLFLVDLDRFKYINDARGHNFGNAVIKDIAGRLLECCSDYSSVFRFGGTEFILVTTQNRFRNISEKLMSFFDAPIAISGSCIHLTASIGYCSFTPGEIVAEEIMMRLDLAKHKAKERGGDCQVGYSETFSEEIQEKVMLSDALRTAIVNKELVMHYQTKVSFESQQTIGYEALLRWNLNGKWIPPDKIISIAEETGLIYALGRLIIEKVFQDSGFLMEGQSIAINLSVMQLEQIGFLEDLMRLRSIYKINSAQFIFEITESVLMQGLENVIRTLHILREQGYRISLDDFGTGYASYNYLSRLPIDELKMDKSLTQSILQSDKDCAIVRHMIEIGQLLNCMVVCEGIELKEEYEILKSFGCDLGQGYYFSVPIPVDRILKVTERVEGAYLS